VKTLLIFLALRGLTWSLYQFYVGLTYAVYYGVLVLIY